MLSFGLLQSLFESIHQNSNELLGVFLLDNIGRLTIEVLEGKVETLGEVIVSLSKLQISHDMLPLMQNIVIDHLTFVVLIVLHEFVVGS